MFLLCVVSIVFVVDQDLQLGVLEPQNSKVSDDESIKLSDSAIKTQTPTDLLKQIASSNQNSSMRSKRKLKLSNKQKKKPLIVEVQFEAEQQSNE